MNLSEHAFLVVDSNAIDRKTICECLQRLGFSTFFEAACASEAVKILNTQKLDVLISDWGLVEASGYSLLKLIKLQEKYKFIHFIMLSRVSADEAEKVKKSAHFGLDGYLLKPFDETKFKILLNDIL